MSVYTFIQTRVVQYNKTTIFFIFIQKNNLGIKKKKHVDWFELFKKKKIRCLSSVAKFLLYDDVVFFQTNFFKIVES